MNVSEFNGRPILDDDDTERRAEFIAGLRAMADWYEARPNLPAPIADCEAVLFPNDKAELAALTREAGTLNKSGVPESDYMELQRKFTAAQYYPVVRFRIAADKSKTCERVKVGEKVLEAQPERIVPETIIPATPEQVVELYEWKCGSVLAPPAVGTAEAAGLAMDEAMQPVVS